MNKETIKKAVDYLDVEDFIKEKTWDDEPVELKEE